MIRMFASVLFALVLGLTGQSMALARGQATATGEMVLCIGGGTVVVPVDAEGQPTGPAHICPDCALSLIVMAEPPHTAEQDMALHAVVFWESRGAQVPHQRHETALPRGPPARALG